MDLDTRIDEVERDLRASIDQMERWRRIGIRAAQKGKPVSANPYSRFGVAWQNWNEGWRSLQLHQTVG